jgi:hypothetical protein
MNRRVTNREVIVPMTRLPENIGRMLNMYLSGEVTTMHILAVTKDEKIINTSVGNVPNVMAKHDSFK